MSLAKELRHYALRDQATTERGIMNRNAFPAQEADEKRDADLRDQDKCIKLACDHDYTCTYDGMDGERYRCLKCGHSYFLDYEEMR